MGIYANRIHLMGNFTRDPELITTDRNGNPIVDSAGNPVKIVNFGLATNRTYTNQQTGKQEQEVCFIDLVAFNRTAEIIDQYCKKGSPLYLEGYLRLDQWETNGVRNQRLKGVAERISLLGAGNGNSQWQQQAEAAPVAG